MNPTNQILTRYLQGKCTPEEIYYIENLLRKNPQLVEEIFLKEEWDLMDNKLPYENENKLQQILSKKINRQKKIKSIVKYSYTIAAVLIGILSINSLYNYLLPESINTKNIRVATVYRKENLSISNLYYINSGNKNMLIKADDGTIITLYPKSEVRYAESFAHAVERKIELKGKAKFEVVKDKTKPFKVYSNGIVTTALGTIFVVDELASSETYINLMEGSIEVKMQKDNIKPIKRIIKPNESLTINHQLGTITEEVKLNNNLANREGYYLHSNSKIIIKNMSLIDVIENLEQNFKLQFIYDAGSLKDKYYSGTFNTSTNIHNQIIKEINYLHKTTIIKK